MNKNPNGKSRLNRLLLAAALFVFAAHLAAAKPVDVLFISANADSGQTGLAGLTEPGWLKFKAACAAQGVNVNILGDGRSTYEALTPELFHQFDVLVVGASPHTYNLVQSRIDAGKAFLRRLDDYHKAGGGLIFVPFGHDDDPGYWTESFGKLYDAQALREKLYDPRHVLHVNPLYHSERCDYFWTNNITAHPVTAGMRGLLLPRHGDYEAAGTVPMIFGKTWTTLIRGADTTRTIGHIDVGAPPEGEYSPDVKGTYDSAPEVVGVRDGQDGSGRMMLFPFHPAHTWANFNSWVLNDAMMLNGYAEFPSDGMKLFVNACHWLAVPAQKAGLGGYVAPPATTRAVVTAVDWSKAQYAPNSWSSVGMWFNARTQEDVQTTELITPNARDFKGILGARTSYGDGNGTVKDYVAEGKKLGLSFIVFLEDLNKIDATRYAKLAADCKANSTADFQVMPGYLFRDTLGIEYFVFNTEIFPKPYQMTADGRIKAPTDFMQAGRNYTSGGIADLGPQKVDPYFLFAYFTIAPYAYDDGKLTYDGLETYKSVQGRLHHHPPVSLTIVRSPKDLANTVANAHINVYHAEDMSLLAPRLGPGTLRHPDPVYITGGPSITRWGTLNATGQPYAPGRQRVRFALEAHSDAGIADVQIIEARTGAIFRHFKPGAAKDFACSIDETHKEHWYLIPLVTDCNGRTAIGATIETFQDGNRISAYMDNNDSSLLVLGWDEKHQQLKQWGGWIPEPFHVGGYYTGDMPGNPFADELVYHGVDGGSVGSGHCAVVPQVEMQQATEPKIAAYYFENWLASFDDVVSKYDGHNQFPRTPTVKFPGCNRSSFISVPQPMQYVDIEGREETVRARYHAPLAANINQVDVTFKKECTLNRVDLIRTYNRVENGPMYVTGKDRDGEWSALDAGGRDGFSHDGVLGAGDYVFLGSDYSGAPAVINLGDTPISYSYAKMHLDAYIDGNQRGMKAGDKITTRFIIVNKPRAGQNNNLWIKKFIADYAIGGGTPRYSYTVSQGKVSGVNYSLNLDPENGGAALTVKKYDLPHNLLVKVAGMPANAVAGRYDPDHKQLLILPVYENTATTSINTTLGDTSLYVGELFHCDNDDVRLSCTQDGVDKLLVEIHNPSGNAKAVKLEAAPGFTPLASLDKSIDVPAYSSVKLELPTPAGALVDAGYKGD